MDEYDISGLPVVGEEGDVVGVISQTDLVRARATEWLWANWPRSRGAASDVEPAADDPPVGLAGSGGGTDGARPRPSPRRRRGRRSDHPYRRHLDERPRSRRSRGMRTMTARRWRSPLTKEPGALKESHEVELGIARRCSTSTRTSRSSGRRSCRPTGRASPTPSGQPMSAWPAASSRQGPPRPATSAASRRCSRSSSPSVCRLHGLCQRLPGQRDPRHRRAGARPRDADRRVRRRRQPHRPSRRRAPRPISSRTQKYAEVPAKHGLEPAALRHLRRARSIARAARSAWRCARPWATTRCS